MVACVCCRVSVCVPVSLCLCMCAYVCVVCVLMFAGAHPITTDVITAVGERGNHADRKTDNRKDRRTDKQTERQINRQKDRQTRRGCESESERDQVSGREIRTHHSRRHSTPPAIRSRAFILYSLFWSQIQREVGGWGRDPFSRNLMSPTPRRKWYLIMGRRAH